VDVSCYGGFESAKMKIILSLAITSMFLVSGCASIFCGESKTISITSDPAGAKFNIKDGHGKVVHTGTTPASVSLKRSSGPLAKGNYTITFEKEGYTEKTVPVKQEFETGWFLCNALLTPIGCLIGGSVDGATGSIYTIENVNTELEPVVQDVNKTPIIETSAITITPQKQVAAKTDPVENLGRVSSEATKCSSCGKTIAKFEWHFLFEDKIVCKNCYEKLNGRTQ
jgi:hypothetical protein